MPQLSNSAEILSIFEKNNGIEGVFLGLMNDVSGQIQSAMAEGRFYIRFERQVLRDATPLNVPINYMYKRFIEVLLSQGYVVENLDREDALIIKVYSF